MKTIGIFDSGMGGVTLVSDLHQSAPELHIIYLGDSLNAPYGVKSTEEIKALSLACAEKLIERSAEAIVIACNTATSAAAPMLRERFSVPIIGMEPALKPAVEHSKGGTVVVLATEYTLHNDKFLKLQKRVAEDKNVRIIAAPGLVNYVEGGMKDPRELHAYLDDLFKDITEVESIVLGCTHFLYLKEELNQFFGREMRYFDGNQGTVRHLLKLHREEPVSTRGTITLLNTHSEEMVERSKEMLKRYEASKQASLDWNLIAEKLETIFSGAELAMMRMHYGLDDHQSLKSLAKELKISQKELKQRIQKAEKKLYRELKQEDDDKLFVKSL